MYYKVADIPDWADELAVDPDGSLWAYEGGCYFDELQNCYMPIDDMDGLRYCKLEGVQPDLAPPPIDFEL